MKVPPQLAEARSCYDHLAGRVGVALFDRLVEAEALAGASDGEPLTVGPGATSELADLGVDVIAVARGRRRLVASCVDWTEKRPHLAGALGAAVLESALREGWVTRAEGRALDVTAEGRERLLR